MSNQDPDWGKKMIKAAQESRPNKHSVITATLDDELRKILRDFGHQYHGASTVGDSELKRELISEAIIKVSDMKLSDPGSQDNGRLSRPNSKPGEESKPGAATSSIADEELDEILEHFFIMRGTNDIPDPYWKGHPGKVEDVLQSVLLAWKQQAVREAREDQIMCDFLIYHLALDIDELQLLAARDECLAQLKEEK